MKKFLLLLPMIALLISCNQTKIETLENRNDSLVQAANAKDQSLDDFLAAFNAIQDNLDSIKEKEMMITEQTSHKDELKTEAKDQINNDINDIYQLLLNTRSQLESAKQNLGKSNKHIKELEKMLSRLSEQIEEKDQEIEELRGELEAMNIKITKLTGDVDRLTEEGKKKTEVLVKQAKTIEEKTTELNEAYYAVGTKKELKDNNIITLEGGFIGLGKAEKLKNEPNSDYFTKIDIRQSLTIPIPGKKAEIITPHPEGSYTIEGEGADQVLKISDYQSFWKSSKYLVVITD